MQYLHTVCAHHNIFMKIVHKTLSFYTLLLLFFVPFVWVIKQQLHFENSNVVISLKLLYPEIKF